MQSDAVGPMQNWLEKRGKQLGPLFTRVTKSGRVIIKRLTPQAVYYLLKHRQAQAGLDDFTPHDLRRTSITDLLSAEVDVLTVSAIAGHASADTTKRYDRRSDENKKAAAQKLPSPFAEPPSPAKTPPRENGDRS